MELADFDMGWIQRQQRSIIQLGVAQADRLGWVPMIAKYAPDRFIGRP